MVKKFFLLIIRGYQLFLSPLFGPKCRFYPTCSEYAKECFVEYNVFKALWKTIFRISRCHPWNKGGFDPVKKNHE